MGDGTTSQFQVYEATVIWDGLKKLVEVNAATSGALIGMRLLETQMSDFGQRYNLTIIDLS